jgi:glutamine amidotransferase
VDKRSVKWLHEYLQLLIKAQQSIVIMSDGEYVFCYHDMCGYNGLHFVERRSPFERVKLVDVDWNVIWRKLNTRDCGIVVASQPLTNDSWQSFRPGELKVFVMARWCSNRRKRCAI